MSSFVDESSFSIEQFNKVCHYDRYMVLKLYVENFELRQMYKKNAEMHNTKLLNNNDFMDAGFDLMLPYNFDKNAICGLTKCESNRVNKLDLQVKCSAQMVILGTWGDISYHDKKYNTGYYMYPRSSISKSCMRLANSVGIIDSGYRGNLIAMVDCVYEEQCMFNPYDRYFQICAPELVPVVVYVVDTVEELGEKTLRGEGGFGSTGLSGTA